MDREFKEENNIIIVERKKVLERYFSIWLLYSKMILFKETLLIFMELQEFGVIDFSLWIGWLVGFYGISTFAGYFMPNHFYTNKQFYFKQFSLA